MPRMNNGLVAWTPDAHNRKEWEEDVLASMDEVAAQRVEIDALTARSTSWPEIDLAENDDLVLGSTTALNRENNAEVLNQLWFDAAMAGTGTCFRLPAETIEIAGQPVGLNILTGDLGAALEIRGRGRRSSRIYQRTDGIHGMEFQTSGGNLRDLYVHDFTVRHSDTDDTAGAYCFSLGKVGYSTFDRLCAFTGGGFYIDDSSFDLDINNFWALNIVGYSIEVRDSAVQFEAPVIGEDGGSIFCSGGTLFIRDAQIRNSWEKVTPGGINAMGESLFISRGDGYIEVSTSKINTDGGQLENVCNIDSGIARFIGNRIAIGEGVDALIVQRTMTTAQHFDLVGNYIEIDSRASAETFTIYDQFIGTEPHDSTIVGNTFAVGTNVTLNIEDTFFKPANNNRWDNNPITQNVAV
jgi:hypothetical protein